jgi:hypothetical protein
MHRQQYLDALMNLAIDELRLTAQGKSTPDTRGKLPGEIKSGGRGSYEASKIIDTVLHTDIDGIVEVSDVAASTKPSGTPPDSKLHGASSRWARVPANEIKSWNKLEQKFRDIAVGNFDEHGHCKVPNCGFVSSSAEVQVDHFWTEYYLGEKLWDKVDQLSDPDIIDTVGPFLIEARKRAAQNAHHWIICGWLRSRT